MRDARGHAHPGGRPDPLRAALEKAAGDHYTIVRLLGRGGMGAVYLAREKALDRDVAIKVLPPETGDVSQSRERFRREARTAARLTHPNIVPLHAFGEAEGTMYFVMGYVRGEPLSARMRRQGRLPLEEAHRILMEVADALDHAHREGVVHRDIKPDNVLIDDASGRAMLTDFGVAKAVGTGQTLTAAGSIVGTPHYMSPEQAAGKEVDGRTDIYSLGVMGYAMLAGRLPFDGKTPGDVLVQHLTKEPPPVLATAPDVPGALASAVMRCLAKDPAARWPDARTLRDVLTSARPGEEGLPAPLDELTGYGTVFLLTALACLYGMVFQRLGRGRIGPEGLYVLLKVIPLLIALAWLAAADKARRQGIAWGASLREAFRQPAWWFCWYPRRLRRPGDLWDRLPGFARRLRSTLAAMILLLAVSQPTALFFASSALLEDPKFGALFHFAHSRLLGRSVEAWFLAFGLLGIAWGVELAWRSHWLERRGLSQPDSRRLLLTTSTANRSFWGRPHIAALLLPAGAPGESVPPPQSPPEYLQSIVRIAGGFTGAFREVGSQAVTATRQMVAALESSEGEIAALARDADPEEAARLEQRLAALGSDTPAEGEDRRQMRQLLKKQLELVHGIGVRLEEANLRRIRRLDLLKGLWSQVAGIKPHTAPESPEGQELMRRLRALCAEIEREARPPETVAGAADTAGIGDLPTLER